MQNIDLLTPNSHEAELLTGIAVVDLASAGRAGRCLQQLGPRQVIITRGAEGAVVIEDEIHSIGSIPVDAVDTTAADAVLRIFTAEAIGAGRAHLTAKAPTVDVGLKTVHLSVITSGPTVSVSISISVSVSISSWGILKIANVDVVDTHPIPATFRVVVHSSKVHDVIRARTQFSVHAG